MLSRGEPFEHVTAEVTEEPVFSEVFLYPRLGRVDARFVLGVADEYARVIRRLGTERVKTLLTETEVEDADQRRADGG